MGNYNRVLLMGNLTRDPEIRYTPSGSAVCDFGIAVNETYKPKDGEKKTETTFVDITAWGRQAEVIAEHFQKGKPIFIEGKLKYSTWEAQDGSKRNKLNVTLIKFEFVESGGKKEGGGASKKASPPDGPDVPSDFDDYEDDIPF